MQKVQVTRVSDLDGSDADESVRFALDGTEYEIDLSGPQAREMRAGLAPFIASARKLPGRRRGDGQRRARRADLPDIREYARSRGHKISDRGRISSRIVAEYDALKGISGSK